MPTGAGPDAEAVAPWAHQPGPSGPMPSATRGERCSVAGAGGGIGQRRVHHSRSERPPECRAGGGAAAWPGGAG